MRISIVMGYFLPVPAVAGGATEKIWLRLGELMAKQGHDVTILSRCWPGLPDQETRGRLTHLRLPGWNHTRHLSANLLFDLLWGRRVLKALPPADVVVCNTVSLPIYLRRFKPGAGRVAVVLGRMPKGQNRAYGGVDCILATSNAVAQKARRENPRIGEKLFQFPNPIDWIAHAEASAQDNPDRMLSIGYVGRIHPEKGLERLVDATARLVTADGLPPWEVRLVGPSAVAQGGGGEAYLDSLRQRASGIPDDRIRFLPPEFDPAALARIFGQFDLFCYPSLAARGEGLSIAPIEAMASGCVPVVSRLDCYSDLIVSGENGFKFDQTRDDSDVELAAILERLLRDAPLRRAVAERAQHTASRFDYPATAELLLAKFENLKRRAGSG